MTNHLHALHVLFAIIVAMSAGSDRPWPCCDAPLEKKAESLKLRAVQADISGYYTCKGQEVSGKGYSGIVWIQRRNEVYLVSWQVGSGSAFSGIGIRQGETFSVAWALPSERGITRGVNVYRVEGKKLTGRWASLPGPGVLQSETLEWLKESEPDE